MAGPGSDDQKKLASVVVSPDAGALEAMTRAVMASPLFSEVLERAADRAMEKTTKAALTGANPQGGAILTQQSHDEVRDNLLAMQAVAIAQSIRRECARTIAQGTTAANLWEGATKQ